MNRQGARRTAFTDEQWDRVKDSARAYREYRHAGHDMDIADYAIETGDFFWHDLTGRAADVAIRYVQLAAVAE